jgi:hypothetical protein
MRRLWHDIQAHPLTVALFAVCWIGTWVISAMIWPEAMGLLQFVLIFVASIFVGWWRMPATAAWSQVHIDDSIKHGLLVAVLVMEIDLVIIAIIDKLSEPAIEATSAPWWGAVAGGLAFFLGFGMIAGAAGMIGGLLGGALAYVVHRWRHRGDPAAPTGVS